MPDHPVPPPVDPTPSLLWVKLPPSKRQHLLRLLGQLLERQLVTSGREGTSDVTAAEFA